MVNQAGSPFTNFARFYCAGLFLPNYEKSLYERHKLKLKCFGKHLIFEQN